MSEVVTSQVPHALPGRVIVKFPPKNLKSASGLITLIKEQEDRNVAEVISVGDGTDKAEEMFARIVKPGMKVIADEYVGDPFTVEKEGAKTEYRIFRAFEIKGYV